MLSQVSLSIDLNQLRSTTTINTIGNKVSGRQNISGSIGIDTENSYVNLSNRQQVGKGAVSVVQFVDVNNSGNYDSGDQLLPYRGLNIMGGTSTASIGRDSILRLSQLQNYYRYNAMVNRNAIADPTLVPLKTEFSFIAEPNQYKRIEIPFYQGGIVEGSVIVHRNGQEFGQGGLKLIIKGTSGSFEKTIRSFNDGGFYTMDIPPGSYTIEVDPQQLEFLNVINSMPLPFEIKSLSEGDFIEGLQILLIVEKVE